MSTFCVVVVVVTIFTTYLEIELKYIHADNGDETVLRALFSSLFMLDDATFPPPPPLFLSFSFSSPFVGASISTKVYWGYEKENEK